jgi:hypothetical protein
LQAHVVKLFTMLLFYMISLLHNPVIQWWLIVTCNVISSIDEGLQITRCWRPQAVHVSIMSGKVCLGIAFSQSPTHMNIMCPCIQQHFCNHWGKLLKTSPIYGMPPIFSTGLLQGGNELYLDVPRLLCTCAKILEHSRENLDLHAWSPLWTLLFQCLVKTNVLLSHVFLMFKSNHMYPPWNIF